MDRLLIMGFIMISSLDLPLRRNTGRLWKKKCTESFMEQAGEDYKLEMIRELPESEKITFYRQGDYVEFCAGSHISNTCQVKAIRLLSVAGAYWKGNEKNRMLTRIYGISFPKASQLEQYLFMLEEAKARDHRKLGQELGLFALWCV